MRKGKEGKNCLLSREWRIYLTRGILEAKPVKFRLKLPKQIELVISLLVAGRGSSWKFCKREVVVYSGK